MNHRNLISRKGSTGPTAIKLTANISGTPAEIELMPTDQAAEFLKESYRTLAPSRMIGDRPALMPRVIRCNRFKGRASGNIPQPADMMHSITPGLTWQR